MSRLRALFHHLERPRSLERVAYRHHRLLGALLCLGSGYVLATWAMDYETAAVLNLAGRHWTARGLDWLFVAGEALVVLLHACVLAVGLVVFLRPSLLKGVERVVNRWHRLY